LQVLDFPKQQVITKDNALISLDAVLSYKVVNSKQMVLRASSRYC
jgi:regulator of protease activity HflC (stomatin/prohibitin superfamily)